MRVSPHIAPVDAKIRAGFLPLAGACDRKHSRSFWLREHVPASGTNPSGTDLDTRRVPVGGAPWTERIKKTSEGASSVVWHGEKQTNCLQFIEALELYGYDKRTGAICGLNIFKVSE